MWPITIIALEHGLLSKWRRGLAYTNKTEIVNISNTLERDNVSSNANHSFTCVRQRISLDSLFWCAMAKFVVDLSGLSRLFGTYRKVSNIRRTKSQNLMLLVSSCSCPNSIRWSQVLSWEWRCSWSSADRRCSNYIWVINNLIVN